MNLWDFKLFFFLLCSLQGFKLEELKLKSGTRTKIAMILREERTMGLEKEIREELYEIEKGNISVASAPLVKSKVIDLYIFLKMCKAH